MTPSKVLVVSVILVGDLISCKKFISPMNLLRALYSERLLSQPILRALSLLVCDIEHV